MNIINTENVDLIKIALKHEIVRVDKKIEYITKLKDEAVANLVKQNEASPTIEIAGEFNDIEKEIEMIEMRHSRIISKQTIIHTAKGDLDTLHGTLAEINKELTLIQERHNVVMTKLREKKGYLQQRLQSIETLDSMQVQLASDVQSEIDAYNEMMELLNSQRAALLARTDLSATEMEAALKEIDDQIALLKSEHILKMNKLGKDVSELQEQISTTLSPHRKEDILKEIERLRILARTATPSQLDLIEKQIAELNNELQQLEAFEETQRLSARDRLEETLTMQGLQMTPSGHIITGSGRIITTEEAKEMGLLDLIEEETMTSEERELLIRLLEERGLRLTPSGRLQIEDGTVYTFDEARQLGLLEGLDVELMKWRGITITESGNILTKDGKLLSRSQAERLGLLEGLNVDELFPAEAETESMSTTTVTSVSDMSTADVHYLKNILGKPLALALAEITAKQPRDPIHYLAHWLYKYRYNQEIDEIKKQELIELLAEREKLAAKALREQAEQDVKEILIDILGRVDTQIDKNEIERELARIQSDSAPEDDDLEDEARDKLGVYNGPTKGQQLT